MAEITVTVRLFASVREAVGRDRLSLALPAGTPAADVWSRLPGVEPHAPAGTRYAINGDWSDAAVVLADGDEVAVILPVSGG